MIQMAAGCKISVRFDADAYMQINEMAEVYGCDMSTIVRAGMSRFLDDSYNADGYLIRNEETKADQQHQP